MAFFDSGILVHVNRTDEKGRDLGEVDMVLKEGKKDGVYLVDASSKGNPVIKTFSPVAVTVFREADAADKSVIGRAIVGTVIAGSLGGVIGGMSGTGKKDAWYLEIEDADGSAAVFRLRNQQDGKSMEKRIRKHIK